jgi:hypothetical protein
MTKTNRGLTVKVGVRAGGTSQRNVRALRVSAGVRAGGMNINHNRSARSI